MRRLTGNEPALGERIEVRSLDAAGERLYRLHFGAAKIAPDTVVDEAIKAAWNPAEKKLTLLFLRGEWEEIADAWQLSTWEAYRDASRLGRKTRLSEAQREGAWKVLNSVWEKLRAAALVTRPGMFSRLAEHFAGLPTRPYDFVVVDEAQDIGVSQLRFLAALAAKGRNGLFFAGDLGTANLPVAVLLEGSGRGRARACDDAEDQLSDDPPDPAAGRPASGNGGGRRGWQR